MMEAHHPDPHHHFLTPLLHCCYPLRHCQHHLPSARIPPRPPLVCGLSSFFDPPLRPSSVLSPTSSISTAFSTNAFLLLTGMLAAFHCSWIRDPGLSDDFHSSTSSLSF